MNKVLAQEIVENIGAAIKGDIRLITPLNKFFPVLFEEKTNNNDEKMDAELKLNKAKMEEFAYWHNRKNKEKGR